MANTWHIDFEGKEIAIRNSVFSTELLVNGEVQDLYWGIFALHVRLFGSFESAGIQHRVKAFVGSKFISVNCAIFIDYKMVFNSYET